MKWEYKIVDLSFKNESVALGALNSLGDQGWELVQMHRQVFYFKRPKTDSGV